MTSKRLLWLLGGALAGVGISVAITATGQVSLSGITGIAALHMAPGMEIGGTADGIPAPPDMGFASETGLVALGDAIINNENAIAGKNAANQTRVVQALSNVTSAKSEVDGGIASKTFLGQSMIALQDQLTAPGSHTLQGCGNTLAAVASVGIGASRDSVARAISTGSSKRAGSMSTEHEAHTMEAVLSPAQTDVSAIFPTGSAGTSVGNGYGDVASAADAANAQAYTTAVTDPYPIPQLPHAIAQRIAGMNPSSYPPSVMQYKSEKNVWNSRMGLATRAFGQIASYYAPLSPQNAWTKNVYASVGEMPPSTSVSAMALLDLQVASRVKSPSWYTHIETDDNTGLLREIALMDASNMDINLRRLKTEQMLLAISAAQYADEVNSTQRKKYMDAYQGVINAVTRQ